MKYENSNVFGRNRTCVLLNLFSRYAKAALIGVNKLGEVGRKTAIRGVDAISVCTYVGQDRVGSSSSSSLFFASGFFSETSFVCVCV